MATDQQRWALALVRAGFHIFPCRPGGKNPATRRGVHDAIRDEAGIVAHWRAHPTHNIGISCGASGLVVIDCDKPKPGWRWPSDWADLAGSQWDGADAYTHLAEQAGGEAGAMGLLSTMATVTPSGGMHFYFQAPPFPVRNSAGLLAPLIDVRAEGGYVLGPGSQVDGGDYVPLTDLPPAPLPGWLSYPLQAITQRRTAHHAYAPASPGFTGPPRPELEAILAEYAAQVHREEKARARTISARILPRSRLADLPDPTPLIEDTLDRHSVILLAGPWGSGKSFIALDWAARLATGRPWQARAVHADEPVLYVAAEGAFGMKRRLDAWECGWGSKLVDEKFFVLTRPVNLLSPMEVAELREQMEVRGIRHVFVDTLARCLIGADENSAKDMGLAVDALYEIREATGDGGTVTAIHHTGKDKTTVRGSSALEAGVDTVYQTTGDARLIQLQRTKRKDGPVEDTLRLTLNPVLDSVVVSAVSATGLSNSQDLIVRVLVSHFSDVGPVSATTLRDVCELPKATFYEALNSLASRGVIAIDGSARSRTAALTGTRPAIP